MSFFVKFVDEEGGGPPTPAGAPILFAAILDETVGATHFKSGHPCSGGGIW